MPKATVVETETVVCDLCGAEVRDGSLFCYNCGGSVSKDEEIEPIPPPTEPIVAHATEPESDLVTKVDPPAVKRKAGRSKVRAANRQPAEIVWEERQGISWGFVIATLVFVIVALGIVIAAFYLR